ncbi:diaminopimelate epimerase [Streptomyces goshikiensis]|uniref:diaminopimelate epimerase n=1 Tax=Streptomyces goshikiensis TaxID=1942 RepID=UPI00331C4386
MDEEDLLAVPFAKGHGTENDFIVLLDPTNRLRLSAADVIALCDRRTGLGADGVLRAVRTAALTGTPGSDAEWFMDYRNPDGSLGAMCGNGIRLLARYLGATGRVPAGPLVLATRAGTRRLTAPRSGDISVEMSWPDVSDRHVTVTAGGHHWPALQVDIGNPHAVVFVDDLSRPGPLLTPPVVTPQDAYPHGVSVEFVRELSPYHLSLRIHERGAGETRSCGTGACAAVAAVLHRRNPSPGPQVFTVDSPGGRLTVTAAPDGALTLAGPAEIAVRGALHLPGRMEPALGGEHDGSALVPHDGAG